VIGASINGVALPTNSISGTTNIGANTQDTITLYGYSFTPGQTLNIAIALNNGATVTTTIIAS
jgi:hypothetical protein